MQPEWTEWFASLSSVAKAAAQLPYAPVTGIPTNNKVISDAEHHFNLNCGKLSNFTRNVLQEEIVSEMPVGEVIPNPTSFGYWIVECVDGEAPKIKNAKTSVALAKYLSSAEGKDVYVFPFYGTALPVTQGPQRYLYLPDGATAVTIPIAKNGRVDEVDNDLLRDVKMQTDYYFGLVEMRTSVVFKEDKKPAQRQSNQLRNDDDFDD